MSSKPHTTSATGLRMLLVVLLFVGLPAGRIHLTAGQQSVDAGDQELAYFCPMHPDETSETPGKCPRCGMTLVLGTPFDMRDARLDFETVPAVPKAGEKLTLVFKIFHP